MKASVVSLPAGKVNLDRYFIDTDNDFYAVMDGTSAGGEFSGLFVEWLAELIQRRLAQFSDVPHSVQDTSELFEKLVRDASTQLPERVSDYYGGRLNPYAHGVGSTLTLVHYVDSNWVIVNSGDSEALLVRDGKASVVTYRDTEFNSWIEDGLIEVVDGQIQFEEEDGLIKYKGLEADIRVVWSAMKRMIRWIGNGAVPHFHAEPAKPGDMLILWTDGAEHLAHWHARGKLRWDEGKVAQAASAVAHREAEHFLAALPSFWDDYDSDRRLWDDATALVVYEG